jgi:hypothetical protein
MSNGALSGSLHPATTQRRGYQYFFYTKHHQAGNSQDAQWDPGLTQDEEFAIFDLADLHDLSNPNGDLFGLHFGPGNKPLDLGTRGEFVAEFPVAAAGQAWHGYPFFPIAMRGRTHTRKPRVPIEALKKMEQAGLLTRAQASRLKRGKPP